NDSDVDTPHANLTASAATTSTNNGTVSMNASGTFTYTPPPGFIGDDTINYTVHDNGTPDLTATGAITVHVVGPRVWFVNPGGANPTVTNGAGAGLTLADGNTIQRINVSGATGAGVTGNAIGTLTYSANTTISGNAGGGLVLSGAASGAISVGAAITTSAGHS